MGGDTEQHHYLPGSLRKEEAELVGLVPILVLARGWFVPVNNVKSASVSPKCSLH